LLLQDSAGAVAEVVVRCADVVAGEHAPSAQAMLEWADVVLDAGHDPVYQPPSSAPRVPDASGSNSSSAESDDSNWDFHEKAARGADRNSASAMDFHGEVPAPGQSARVWLRQSISRALGDCAATRAPVLREDEAFGRRRSFERLHVAHAEHCPPAAAPAVENAASGASLRAAAATKHAGSEESVPPSTVAKHARRLAACLADLRARGNPNGAAPAGVMETSLRDEVLHLRAQVAAASVDEGERLDAALKRDHPQLALSACAPPSQHSKPVASRVPSPLAIPLADPQLSPPPSPAHGLSVLPKTPPAASRRTAVAADT
jgi:hypothetical protein